MTPEEIFNNPIFADIYRRGYDKGYVAGMDQNGEMEDDKFWLRTYAGQAMQSAIIVNNGAFNMRELASMAVAQASELLEQIKLRERKSDE